MYAASALPVPCLCQTAAQSSSPVCTVPCRNKHLTPVSLITWRPRQDTNLILSWSLSLVSPSKSPFSQWLSSSSSFNNDLFPIFFQNLSHLFGKLNISELFNPPIFSTLSRKVDSLFCCAFLVRFLQFIISHPSLSLIFEEGV